MLDQVGGGSPVQPGKQVRFEMDSVRGENALPNAGLSAVEQQMPLPAGGGQAPLPPGFVESQKLGPTGAPFDPYYKPEAEKPFDPYRSSSEPVVPPQQPIADGPRK
jgi:hypothetical protein